MPGYLKGVGITGVVTVPYSLASQEAGKPPSAWGGFLSSFVGGVRVPFFHRSLKDS